MGKEDGLIWDLIEVLIFLIVVLLKDSMRFDFDVT